MSPENPGQIKGPGTESMCPTRNHPQQRPIRIWLLPAGLSSRVSQQNADRLVELVSFPRRTIFYEESVLLKYFPLDASCVSRTWSCQLELMTVEKNTSKCCCDMVFGNGGAHRGVGVRGGGGEAAWEEMQENTPVVPRCHWYYWRTAPPYH